MSLIAVSFDAPTAGAQVCPDLVELAPSGNANGELASGDCTLDEIGTSPDDPAVADLYRVTLTTSGFLSVGLESSAFDAVVDLADQTLTVLLASDDDGGSGSNALIDPTLLLPGDYIILVKSLSSSGVGEYTLSTTLTTPAGEPCLDLPDILPNATASGSLAAQDCKIAELGINPQNGAFVDLHHVDIAASGRLTVGLDSTDFDAFLAVENQTLTGLIALDDDGGGGTNALTAPIVVFPGSYVILVTSFAPGETGAYTLTTALDPSPGDPCVEVTDIGLDETANGTLSSQDCTVAELGLNPGDVSFVDSYRLTLATSAFVSMRLESPAFDAYLELYDAELSRFIAADDDSAGGTDALIEPGLLLPGSYLLLANSLSPGERGDYTISVPEPSVALSLLAGLCGVLCLQAWQRRRF